MRPMLALQRLWPGVFYGWVIAVACAVLASVSVGIGFYGQTVLLDALVRERGWARSAIAGASTLYFLTAALSGTLVGRGVDRYGARRFLLVGVTLMAAALIWVGALEGPGQLYLAYPLMGLGFAMAGGIPANALIARWFVVRRARAMSISQTGVSVGGVILVPLATWLFAVRGIEEGSLWLALLLVAVALPVVVFALRFDPRSLGLEPDGQPEPPAEDALLHAAQRVRWTAREVLATPTFWLLAAGFGGILFAQQGILIHQLSLLADDLGSATAAWVVSATPAASIVGRLVVGGLADRVDHRRVVSGLAAIQAAALIGFACLDGAGPLALASAALGLTIGSIFMMQSIMVGALFGYTSFGTVAGLLGLIVQACGAMGPVSLALARGAAGRYETALLALAALLIASSGVVLWVPTPRHPALASGSPS